MTRAMRIEYNKDKHKKGFHTKNKHHVNALRYCLVALKECELAKFVVMRHAYHRVHRPKDDDTKKHVKMMMTMKKKNTPSSSSSLSFVVMFVTLFRAQRLRN